MSAILILILIGIIVGGGALIAFIWAVRDGQYDDDYSPSVRILFENEQPPLNGDEEKSEEIPDKKDKI